MTSKKARHPETLLVHGRERDTPPTGATLPPVHLTTAFDFASAEDMEAVFTGQAQAPYYSRMQNPTVEALEERITEACDALGTVAFASGMSAITAGLLTFLRAGDEVLASPFLFGGSYTLLTQTLPGLGITTTFIDPTAPDGWEAALTERTRAVFVEAIANPAIVVPDFPALRGFCDAHHLPLLVDASLLTPYLYDPERLEADLLFFSATKYLAGPASTVGGLVVDPGRYDWHQDAHLDFGEFKQKGREAFLSKLRLRIMAAVGPSLSPMNAFLLLVGLETLPLRMERQCDNAQQLATFLREHPKVSEVHYAGLPDHPAHRLSGELFRGKHGALIAFKLADKQACFDLLNHLRLIRRSTNLGDTRTLIIHAASTIYGTFWKHEREEAGVDETLIRLSVGIEHPADLIADLEQALLAA